MKASEAAEVIDAISRSMRENPTQFHFTVNVAGPSTPVYGGGIGASVPRVGGGIGTAVTGPNVLLSSADITIAQGRGTRAFVQKLEELASALADLAQQLRSPQPDRPRIERLVASMTGTWVPGVVTSVVGKVVSMAMGSGRS